ncbi:5-deoxy-glucuronate isomerase [Embleya sp. NPDC050154]|uniref:5-deoxy-glucuronate isomerase n=1 Tax=Embleya sp. NPDC050154 TaxID=3363988 RepID=UPI0037AD968A
MNDPTLFHPWGTAGAGDDPLLITPELAGWCYSGLRVVHLPPGGERVLATGEHEVAVIPLAGSVTVQTEGRRFELAGRESVFTAVSDFAYVPRDAELRLSGTHGCQLALASARATRRLDPAYGPAAGVPVEVRGTGRATRQANNLMTPDVFEADKLIVCEILTPDGNWSSHPPHKHDTASAHESVNEEIYFFRVAGRDGRTPDRTGFGLHRTYTTDGTIDETVTVRDGDVFLVPRGYHGPCVATPGHHLYYLNVMAGPADERAMLACDDPAHHWMRESWAEDEPDPRCPLTPPPAPNGGTR